MTARASGHRLPAVVRLLGLLATVAAAVAGGGNALDPARHSAVASAAATPLTGPARYAGLAAAPGRPGPGGDPYRTTLVLYDEGGESRLLGHQYAIQAGNLASRGSSWLMRPVDQYQAGEIAQFDAVIVVDTDAGDLPSAFLADVADAAVAGSVPVLWMGGGVDQLFAFRESLAERLGWSPDGYDPAAAVAVKYGGRRLDRSADDQLVRVSVTDPSAAEVLGLAVHKNGSTTPWAVRSGDLTFIAEIPFSYAEPGDRYLAGADLILRTVAPDPPRRLRALVRIEDVGPNTSPEQIRAITNVLADRKIPFSLAVYPYYRDPHGAANQGRPTSYRLVDRPDLVLALKYATERGGVLLMHGLTHQYADRPNPYTGTSAADYEFYLAHVDAKNNVQLDGPVPGDSEAWARQRLAVGRGEFVRVGLPDPGIFEFPHYTASAPDYRAVNKVFGVRYDQGSYFDGQCPGGDCTKTGARLGEMFQQYFPYPVRDVYGSVVIPEDLGNISEAYNNNPARTAEDILAAAAATTVVRDAVASFFFHPFLDTAKLAQVVDGMRKLGYTFVSPEELIR